ncbi:glycine cleavage system aminomethyltransferase GcvT [bacterium]|nr:glycine cleavage system aminomethyltransferase GcvT [bacterium]
MSSLLRTPLYDWHVAHHGRMVEFGGWEMPVQYTSIVDEHHAVRKAAGLFDISHMGRFSCLAPEAAEVIERLVTCSVATMKPGQIRYGLVCRDDGGILDDVLVYNIPSPLQGKSEFGLVVNAGNRTKIWDWIQTRAPGPWTDVSANKPMIALQGPKAVELVRQLPFNFYSGPCQLPAELGYYRNGIWFREKRYGHIVSVSRTGYTGEDGFEFICGEETVKILWDHLIELGAQPCGLGARDTLRLEAAMPLYGHELSETIDPLTAGLDFAVKLDKADFIGKQALVEIATKSDRRVRVGLKLAGRRIAREGSTVHLADQQIGEVTSGTFSPTLEQAISMAYVAPAMAAVGTAVKVDIRGKREAATVVPLPFYQRAK